MSQQKRQHYVPVFYLKEFSSDGKRINLWNIPQKKKILGGLKGQCQKNFFYGDDRKLEKMLGNIESRTSKVLKDVADNNRLPSALNRGHRDLMHYILIQHLRTPYANKGMIDKIKQLKNSVEDSKVFVSERLRKRYDQEYKIMKKYAPQLSTVFAFSDFDSISDLKMKLIVNKTKTEFVTSDHPVVLYNQLLHYDAQIQQIPYPTTGLVAKGIQLFFPISPTKVLLMYDDHVYSVGNSDRTNIPIYHKQDVTAINMLQMCSGSQNIYFKDGAFDVEDLHGTSEPYIRRVLNDFRSTPKPKKEDFTDPEQRISQFEFITSRGVYTNLNLSIVRLKAEAKQFQVEIKRSLESGTFSEKLRDKLWRKLPVDDGTDRLKPFADILEPIRKEYVESMRQDVGKHWHEAIKSFLKMP